MEFKWIMFTWMLGRALLPWVAMLLCAVVIARIVAGDRPNAVRRSALALRWKLWRARRAVVREARRHEAVRRRVVAAAGYRVS